MPWHMALHLLTSTEHALQPGEAARLVEACAMQALVIGTDIPDLSASILDTAVAALDSHQVLTTVGMSC